MEESSYKHNYEYLSIEEAKSIISGTFVQGTTNIGGELVTKSDINKLLTTANKKLTSIVPSTVADNEFVCFFECINKEEFPDDVAHRWIEVSPIQFTFPANGGSVKITGSYGLTGTLGTRKKVGDINDTITVGANATPSSKSGSKTYHYSNDQSQKPTAKVSWTQPNKEEEFPDDAQHRWIRVQPESSQISVDGGIINVTGSYGLTGTYGTEKKVGDITDTITVERNSTQSPKSGSKTYHYNNNQTDNPTAKITWTQPGRAEEFPKEWTYVFQYNISDTNGGSSTGTSWSRQYYANGQEIKHADDTTLNDITSYRIKTGTFGTVKKENVQYSGQIGRPSGYNYSDKAITQSGQLVQQGSNKQLQWSYTQEANVKVWGISADPTSLHFTASGGTSNVQVTTWYTWQYNDNNNQKFGQATTEEQITVEANTSTQQKKWTKTITKNGKSVSIKCTQDGREEVFTYKYFIKVGYKLDTLLTDRIQLVWQSDQYSQSSKKTFYVRSYKQKINERGEVVATEQTGYSLKHNSSGSDNFSISNRNTTTGFGQVDCFPIEENTSYQSQKTIGFQVYNVEDETVFCHINLIQERKDIQLISGDAIMFTYNWDKGRDLDQGTFININHPNSNNYNYAGFNGRIIPEYEKILYFAGDNMGIGNEYAFVDFKSISKYLQEYGHEASSIDGKTILESLIDDNGIIKIECDLYTNWYNTKEQEDITLSYSVYNKDSEDASVTVNNLKFTLTGYTKTSDNSSQALCYACGIGNGAAVNRDIRKGYTLSAKFIYYLNSGVFSFETNKNNVGKWNKGHNITNVYENISCSDVRFTNDGENVNLSFSLDSLNIPDNFDKEIPLDITFGMTKVDEYWFGYLYRTTGKTYKLPYRFNISKPLTQLKNANFGENQSVEVYPTIKVNSSIINYDSNEALFFREANFKNNTITIQKPSA